MKKIVASVGLVALSAATLHAAYTPGLSELETKKPWSVGLTLRGFYDDNIEATHSGEIDSFGYEVNPWVGINWAGDQTLVGATYAFSGKYYEADRPDTDDHWSMSHVFDVLAQHAFNPRYNVSVRDSFVIGQEPDLLRSVDSGSSDALQRVDGDNIRNYGNLTFNAQLTKTFGLSAAYINSYWNYADDGYSGTLDRIEHMPQIDARWQFQPQTVGLIGYRYRDVKYTADQIIAIQFPDVVESDSRNYRAHYGYVGVEHQFRPDLFASIRGGVSDIDNYNDPNGTTGITPYVNASLTYEHSANTTLGAGVSQDFGTTDIVGDASDFVRGVDNTVAYIWCRQRLAPSLYLTGKGTFQYSVYDGGGDGVDGEADIFLVGNINLEYWFNKHLSAQLGYSIDYLDSDIQFRGYDRNRVYVGLSATY